MFKFRSTFDRRTTVDKETTKNDEEKNGNNGNDGNESELNGNKATSWWNIKKRYYQRFRKRFDVQKNEKKQSQKNYLRKYNDSTTDELSTPYQFDDGFEIKNWQYHLTNQHF